MYPPGPKGYLPGSTTCRRPVSARPKGIPSLRKSLNKLLSQSYLVIRFPITLRLQLGQKGRPPLKRVESSRRRVLDLGILAMKERGSTR